MLKKNNRGANKCTSVCKKKKGESVLPVWYESMIYARSDVTDTKKHEIAYGNVLKINFDGYIFISRHPLRRRVRVGAHIPVS
jgi:hypothetical protein